MCPLLHRIGLAVGCSGSTTGSRSPDFCLNNVRKALLCAHRADHALAVHGQALTLCEEIDERPVAAKIHYDIGEVYQQLARPTNAIGHYRAAVDTGGSVGDVLTTTWALVGLGEATAELGEHATAARYAEQAGAMIGAFSELGPTDELASRIDALRSRVAPLIADVK
ncbi:tetratricopeptide repeat protein [Actinophytocola glycyrrhizae]|uniref:Tetratricopeptide repeat protein n=1 Tax=Actinophytocola glycyrrhizae TaxID=2044873 RepID=A0ABV9SC45_9PSEU